jgi:hypothetical protein
MRLNYEGLELIWQETLSVLNGKKDGHVEI